jgi:nuclear transcription Y subunit beta
MSDSPQSTSKDVDHGAQSPDEETQMNDPQDPQAGGLGYELAEGVKEQDRWLPIANVARIMKNALPENAKIAKEAKECMQECVSEFISFITSEASEKCQQEKRKTVNGEDILYAMTSLGFENYSEALKVYLTKYREQQNQSNRERALDHNWSHQIMPGEKGEGMGPEYAGAEGSNSVKPGGDANYMYSSEAGHNGQGSTGGEGF